MKADQLDDGIIAVSGKAGLERFVRIWGGMGWPDREPGYLCVTGQREDGRYHCLWEKRGGLWELGDAALEANQMFLMDYLWVDARDEVSTSYLRGLNGLCFSEADESNAAGGTAGPVPLFRPKFGADGIPVVVAPVPERILNNYRSALEKIRGIIGHGRLLIHPTNCPRLVYTLRQPLDELIVSPIMKGLIWVVSALEQTSDNGLSDWTPPEPWYENVPRGR